MYVKEHPQLINAISRGTKKYQKLKQFSSGSERVNSTTKEDIPILRKPRVCNGRRAATLAQMTGIVILLKRAFSCVVKTTTLFRKYLKESNSATKTKMELLLKTSPSPHVLPEADPAGVSSLEYAPEYCPTTSPEQAPG